jgi:hypothetical protein
LGKFYTFEELIPHLPQLKFYIKALLKLNRDEKLQFISRTVAFLGHSERKLPLIGNYGFLFVL